jgi:hypothetical protein
VTDKNGLIKWDGMAFSTGNSILRKGRHWDIWMSVGGDIEDAPCLYFALSTEPDAFVALARKPNSGMPHCKSRSTSRETSSERRAWRFSASLLN